VSTLQLLENIVDIYMPDMKYADTEIAEKLSGVVNYPAVNRRAVKEMHRQVGDLKLNEKGVAEKGLLIRHLVLPDSLSGTGEIINFITNEISKNTYLNLMNQYRPEYHAMQFLSLSRRISQEEYLTAVKQALGAGIKRLD
jgi:putative pyruvate formate lyase activating enzyme